MVSQIRRTKSGTKTSDPRLSDAARHVVVPKGIVNHGWPSVRDTLSNLGITFDQWQQDLSKIALGKRKDGLYAAGIGGVVLSIPRQVGKTFWVGCVVFALCLLRPGIKVVWTAHHTDTADETFDAMQELIKHPKFKAHVRKVLTGGGKQRIIFNNKSRIEFGARESGFGRGKTKVAILVLDEFQHVSESALENLTPTANQGDNPLLFMMGTPPRPVDRGDAFKNKRRRALKGQSKDVLYVEMSADEDADLDDRKQWRKANPSFPKRTPAAAMLRMRENLATEDSFRREALGIWGDDTGEKSLISVSDWANRRVSTSPDGIRSFGIKFSAAGDWASLAVAVKKADDTYYVELIESRSLAEGHRYFLDFIKDVWRSSASIIFDGKSDAQVFYQGLRALKIPDPVINLNQKLLSPTAASAAYSGLNEAVRSKIVTHPGDDYLDTAVSNAAKRLINKTTGSFGYGPLHEGDDVTPVEAVALALHGAMNSKRNPGRKQRSEVLM